MVGKGITEAAEKIRKLPSYWQKVELTHIRVEFGEENRAAVVEEMERLNAVDDGEEIVIVEEGSHPR